MKKTHVKRHEKRQGRENKIFKILPNNQIITACCIELQVQKMTMNEKLTMIGLRIILYRVSRYCTTFEYIKQKG